MWGHNIWQREDGPTNASVSLPATTFACALPCRVMQGSRRCPRPRSMRALDTERLTYRDALCAAGRPTATLLAVAAADPAPPLAAKRKAGRTPHGNTTGKHLRTKDTTADAAHVGCHAARLRPGHPTAAAAETKVMPKQNKWRNEERAAGRPTATLLAVAAADPAPPSLDTKRKAAGQFDAPLRSPGATATDHPSYSHRTVQFSQTKKNQQRSVCQRRTCRSCRAASGSDSSSSSPRYNQATVVG